VPVEIALPIGWTCASEGHACADGVAARWRREGAAFPGATTLPPVAFEAAGRTGAAARARASACRGSASACRGSASACRGSAAPRW
jgi:hypothetical protein